MDLTCDSNVFRTIWEALHYTGPSRLSSRLWPFTPRPVSIQQNSRPRKPGLDFQGTLIILYPIFVRQLLTFAFLKNQTELEYLLGMVSVQFNARSRLVGFLFYFSSVPFSLPCFPTVKYPNSFRLLCWASVIKLDVKVGVLCCHFAGV